MIWFNHIAQIIGFGFVLLSGTGAAVLIADASGALYERPYFRGGTGCPGFGCGTVLKLTLPATFTGVPGQANHLGLSISFMAKKYGGIAAAATAFGYASVQDLQNAVASYCAG